MYKEVSCAAEGHRHCRVIGKPADVWGEHDPEVAMFRTHVVPQGLPETVAALSGQGRATKVKPQRGSSAVDRALLAPVVDGLERLAAARLPVLISGQPGTGKKHAVVYLHTALGAEGAGPARLHCGGLDVPTLAQHLGQKGTAKRKQGVPRILVLEDIELLSQEAQACLDVHLGEMAECETVMVATTSLAQDTSPGSRGFGAIRGCGSRCIRCVLDRFRRSVPMRPAGRCDGFNRCRTVADQVPSPCRRCFRCSGSGNSDRQSDRT